VGGKRTQLFGKWELRICGLEHGPPQPSDEFTRRIPQRHHVDSPIRLKSVDAAVDDNRAVASQRLARGT
jgi:hypothetical protein